MIYRYKAVSQDGEMIEGYFEGSEKSDVLAMLKGNNYLTVSIEKDIEAEAQIDIFSSKVKKKDLAVFCRQFYTMLDAGIGIVKCIEILEKQSENKNLVKALGALYENVQKGFTLSEGMKKHPKVFPALLINMIEAGEVSGNLDTIMERMAVHFEKENKLENKIKSALIYPIALAVVSIAVVIFLLVAVMPTFIGMFESSGQALPVPTQVLLNISNWLTNFWYIFIVIVVGMIAGFGTFRQTPIGRNFLDTLKLKIPIVKDTNVKIITSRFTRTLSTLISSGIPLLQSIDVVAKVVGNKVVHDRLAIAAENVRKGVALSRAINEMGVFPPMVDSMIKIGEESGSLDDILYKTADFYDDEVEVALQRMTSLMEPLMLVVMAVVIGFIVIAMAMPMFDMVNTIQ
ncbi:type II secretion system protein F [Tissierella sp. P1]|jgi:type IV pilus assembly protein PilC|uniref:type II secretion system F family protein n=1 Tax=Tissierella TaxID=41273 RepID=UPI000BA10A33|nr:type II secretion system F family protein [Tissierella sp. P1]MDU5080049.1 type II secretion system F family protein [Bacillota bacterium]OZV12750.1 type II secretion system protein F [Tissierella sp. P1]